MGYSTKHRPCDLPHIHGPYLSCCVDRPVPPYSWMVRPELDAEHQQAACCGPAHTDAQPDVIERAETIAELEAVHLALGARNATRARRRRKRGHDVELAILLRHADIDVRLWDATKGDPACIGREAHRQRQQLLGGCAVAVAREVQEKGFERALKELVARGIACRGTGDDDAA